MIIILQLKNDIGGTERQTNYLIYYFNKNLVKFNVFYISKLKLLTQFSYIFGLVASIYRLVRSRPTVFYVMFDIVTEKNTFIDKLTLTYPWGFYLYILTMLKTRVVLRITSVGKYNKINKVLGYSVLKKFDYITNCETELNNIKLINTNSRTICVRNALDTKSFYPDNKKVINKTIFTFGYLGRFSSEKNIELIIRSFSLLPYKIKNNSKLVLIGYKNNCCKECSNYYKIIYKLVESLNLQDDVIFKPAIPLVEVSKIRQEYQSFDTYILASKSEGLSNSVIESLACNTPVVCYKNNLAVREVIDKCDCEVFSKLTSKSLSKVLLTVYKDRKKDNGFNSANIVKSYYNLSIELKKCLNFLKLQPQ